MESIMIDFFKIEYNMTYVTEWLNENIGPQGDDWDWFNSKRAEYGDTTVFVFAYDEHAIAFKLMFL